MLVFGMLENNVQTFLSVMSNSFLILFGLNINGNKNGFKAFFTFFSNFLIQLPFIWYKRWHTDREEENKIKIRK